jgi:hypothetical protein
MKKRGNQISKSRLRRKDISRLKWKLSKELSKRSRRPPRKSSSNNKLECSKYWLVAEGKSLKAW